MNEIDYSKEFTDAEIQHMLPTSYDKGMRAVHYNGHEPLFYDNEHCWYTKYGYARIYQDRFISGELYLPQKWKLNFISDTEWYLYEPSYKFKICEDGVWYNCRGFFIEESRRGFCLPQDISKINRVRNLLASKPKPRCEYDEFMYNRLRIAVSISERADFFK